MESELGINNMPMIKWGPGNWPVAVAPRLRAAHVDSSIIISLGRGGKSTPLPDGQAEI
jgi:hypothetical protein